MNAITRWWIAMAIVAGFAACSKLDLGGGGTIPTPTGFPTATPTAGPTPGACGTPSSDAETVLVAMSNLIGPIQASSYGTINGYAVVENGQYPGQTMVIDQWLNPAGNVVPITSNNLVQFVNVDTGGANHSAVGFKGTAFPPVPYTFPKAAASPTANAVSTTSLWSTGRVAPPVSAFCYSQSFKLSAGVFYFGDLDYYNLSNFRDVLIVVTPTP